MHLTTAHAVVQRLASQVTIAPQVAVYLANCEVNAARKPLCAYESATGTFRELSRPPDKLIYGKKSGEHETGWGGRSYVFHLCPGRASMPPDRAQELARIEALIEQAEDKLKALRLKGNGRPPSDPSDPFDPISCLEIWLAALRGRRADLLRSLH
jgi:hypothetical protein